MKLVSLSALAFILGGVFFLAVVNLPEPQSLSVPQYLSARVQSLYSPGDCLRTPVVEPSLLERWEEPPAFKTLYMISEVGDSKYRLREWGTQRSSTPQWYPGYAEALPFKVLDNRNQWQPVPCPEQGPDPEETTLRLTSSFVGGGGNVIYFNSYPAGGGDSGQ